MENKQWNGVRRMKLHLNKWHGFESCVGLLIVTLHHNKCQLNWRLSHRWFQSLLLLANTWGSWNYIYIHTQYNSIKISRYQHASRSATHGFTVIYHTNYYYIHLSSSILWNLKIGLQFSVGWHYIIWPSIFVPSILCTFQSSVNFPFVHHFWTIVCI